MRRIDRYITKSVAGAILMVLAVVLSLDLVFAFVAEVEDFRSGYGLTEALAFVATTVPRRIYDYLPLGAFMGCLIGLGLLSKNSELIVIRAAGVSLWRIVLSAMKPAFVVVFLGVVLGEFVVPLTEKIAQSQKAVALGAGKQVSTASGLWHREGDTFIHVNAVEPNGILHGLSMHTYDESLSLTRSKFVKRAIYQRGEWLLEDVRETRIGDGMNEYYAPYEIWETQLSPSTLNILVVKPESLSVSGLYGYIDYLESQNLSASVYLLAFWKKILQPLSTVVLVFVAISFVFGPLRSATMGFRVFCGLIVGLVFKYMQDLLGPSSLVFGFEPVYATLVPIAICALFGWLLLRRTG